MPYVNILRGWPSVFSLLSTSLDSVTQTFEVKYEELKEACYHIIMNRLTAHYFGGYSSSIAFMALSIRNFLWSMPRTFFSHSIYTILSLSKYLSTSRRNSLENIAN
jgi:hypothetical protein